MPRSFLRNVWFSLGVLGLEEMRLRTAHLPLGPMLGNLEALCTAIADGASARDALAAASSSSSRAAPRPPFGETVVRVPEPIAPAESCWCRGCSLNRAATARLHLDDAMARLVSLRERGGDLTEPLSVSPEEFNALLRSLRAARAVLTTKDPTEAPGYRGWLFN